MSDSRDKLRRTAGWALVGGLSVAALTAVAALLARDFDDTDLRVICSSLGFVVTSAVASSGLAQRLRASGLLRALGTATAGLAALAYVLLLAGLWTNDWGTEGIWRAFGCAALLAVAGGHAGVVLGAQRRSDAVAAHQPAAAADAQSPARPAPLGNRPSGGDRLARRGGGDHRRAHR